MSADDEFIVTREQLDELRAMAGKLHDLHRLEEKRCLGLAEALCRIAAGAHFGIPASLIARTALDEYRDSDSSEVQARADVHDRVAGGVAEADAGDQSSARGPA